MGGRASSEEFEDRYHGLSLANATKIFNLKARSDIVRLLYGIEHRWEVLELLVRESSLFSSADTALVDELQFYEMSQNLQSYLRSLLPFPLFLKSSR